MSTKVWSRLALGAFALAAVGLGGPAAQADAAGQDLLSHARSEVAELGRHGVTLQDALRGARASSQHQRARCLDDALTRTHVATRTAMALSDSIAHATAASDTLSASLNAFRLDRLRERANHLFQEALRCGNDQWLSMPGESTTVRVVLPVLPDDAGFPVSPNTR